MRERSQEDLSGEDISSTGWNIRMNGSPGIVAYVLFLLEKTVLTMLQGCVVWDLLKDEKIQAKNEKSEE